MKSFVKQTIAALTGDDKEVIAQHNYRKAETAVRSQLASLENSKIDAESDVTNAQEELVKAKYPAYKITDVKDYLQQVKRAYEALESAKDVLKGIDDNIAFYTTFKAEVEAEA